VDRAVEVQQQVAKRGRRRADYRLLRDLFFRQGWVLAELGEYDAAARAAERTAVAVPEDPIACACAARVLATCASRAAKDGRLPAPRRQELAEDCGRKAVAWLRQALARGLEDPSALERHPDLRPLHGREDFRKLWSEVKTGTRPKEPTPLP
jgi:hypothetical protein